MFTVKTPGTLVATISELKKHTREIIDAARLAPVVIVRDGQPVSSIISMELLQVLEEALEDRLLANVSAERLAAIQSGEEAPLEHDAFWAQVELERTPNRPTASKAPSRAAKRARR